nr:TetR/AcrR family transcriptional regulator [Kibdelosporangium sp. MJ126-NF4]CEL13654.1 Transcriptional regulator, TetR family [Kibdelosporangium sp. MJ126-NF4]CTQ99340.1 Transcriptional regulator, TetR family [Kibdelosporangium sp. MJ126-NF4]
MARATLSREQIVATAVEVADEGGLDAVTMRLVGQRLNASGMALYRHVANREALLEAMIDAVAGEYAYPEPRPRHWRDALTAMAWQDWRSYFAHPWFLAATATCRPALGPRMLESMEWALAAFDECELSSSEKLNLLGVITSYVQGLALTWTQQGSSEGVPEWWRDRLLGTGLRRLEAVATDLGDNGSDLEHDFGFGLTRALDGIELYLKDRAARSL